MDPLCVAEDSRSGEIYLSWLPVHGGVRYLSTWCCCYCVAKKRPLILVNAKGLWLQRPGIIVAIAFGNEATVLLVSVARVGWHMTYTLPRRIEMAWQSVDHENF